MKKDLKVRKVKLNTMYELEALTVKSSGLEVFGGPIEADVRSKRVYGENNKSHSPKILGIGESTTLALALESFFLSLCLQL